MNWINLLFMFEIYIIICLAANLVTGYTGLLSFANASFYGIGAFTTAILMVKYNFNFFITLPVSMLIAGLAGYVLSLFARRLHDLYFVIASIGFQIIIYTVLENMVFQTFETSADGNIREVELGGKSGVSKIPEASLFGFEFSSDSDYVILGAALSLLIIMLFIFLRNTPFMKNLEGIRDNELAVISIGKNINKFKTTTVVLSAAITAISGALYAVYYNYVDTEKSFDLDESILIVCMILIGGTGNIKGPVFGALFFVLLPEITRLIPISNSQGANIRLMIYGLTMIIAVIFKPSGLFGNSRIK